MLELTSALNKMHPQEEFKNHMKIHGLIIPNEIIFLIFKNIPEEIHNKTIPLVCREWRQLCRNKFLWTLILNECSFYDLKVRNHKKPWLCFIPEEMVQEALKLKKVIPIILTIDCSNLPIRFTESDFNIVKEKESGIELRTIYTRVYLYPKEGKLMRTPDSCRYYTYTDFGNLTEPKFEGPAFIPREILKKAHEQNKPLYLKWKGFIAKLDLDFKIRNLPDRAIVLNRVNLVFVLPQIAFPSAFIEPVEEI